MSPIWDHHGWDVTYLGSPLPKLPVGMHCFPNYLNYLILLLNWWISLPFFYCLFFPMHAVALEYVFLTLAWIDHLTALIWPRALKWNVTEEEAHCRVGLRLSGFLLTKSRFTSVCPLEVISIGTTPPSKPWAAPPPPSLPPPLSSLLDNISHLCLASRYCRDEHRQSTARLIWHVWL